MCATEYIFCPRTEATLLALRHRFDVGTRKQKNVDVKYNVSNTPLTDAVTASLESRTGFVLEFHEPARGERGGIPPPPPPPPPTACSSLPKCILGSLSELQGVFNNGLVQYGPQLPSSSCPLPSPPLVSWLPLSPSAASSGPAAAAAAACRCPSSSDEDRRRARERVVFFPRHISPPNPQPPPRPPPPPSVPPYDCR